MPRFILLSVLFFLAFPVFAFNPSTTVDYVIALDSMEIGNYYGNQASWTNKQIDCGLQLNPILFYPPVSSTTAASFDCFQDGMAVRFVKSSNSWKIRTLNPDYPAVGAQWCYLKTSTGSGIGVHTNEKKLVWDCIAATGSLFNVQDDTISDRFYLATSRGDCGIQRSDEVIQDGPFNHRHQAKVNCTSPTGFSLRIMTRTSYLGKTIKQHLIGSDGCSGGTSAKYETLFQDACIRHDACYSNPWHNTDNARKQCNTDFKTDMLNKCNATYAWGINRSACRTNAGLFYDGVELLGWNAWNGDQTYVRSLLMQGVIRLRFSQVKTF